MRQLTTTLGHDRYDRQIRLVGRDSDASPCALEWDRSGADISGRYNSDRKQAKGQESSYMHAADYVTAETQGRRLLKRRLCAPAVKTEDQSSIFTGAGFDGITIVGDARVPPSSSPVGIDAAGFAFASTVVSWPVEEIRVSSVVSVCAVVVV